MNAEQTTRPTDLTLDQSAALSLHIRALADYLNGLGVTAYITLHQVSRLSAWEAFPDGVEDLLRDGGHAMGRCTVKIGSTEVVLFTGVVS